MKEDFRTEDREVHETESVQEERLNDSVPDKAIIRGLLTENRIYKKKEKENEKEIKTLLDENNYLLNENKKLKEEIKKLREEGKVEKHENQKKELQKANKSNREKNETIKKLNREIYLNRIELSTLKSQEKTRERIIEIKDKKIKEYEKIIETFKGSSQNS